MSSCSYNANNNDAINSVTKVQIMIRVYVKGGCFDSLRKQHLLGKRKKDIYLLGEIQHACIVTRVQALGNRGIKEDPEVCEMIVKKLAELPAKMERIE